LIGYFRIALTLSIKKKISLLLRPLFFPLLHAMMDRQTLTDTYLAGSSKALVAS